MSQAVYFLLLPNVLSLDVSGPAETLRLAGQFSLRYLSPAPQIVCSIGMTLSGLQPLPERLEDGAILVLPGVGDSQRYFAGEEAEQARRWLATLRPDLQRQRITLVCICSGALLAAQAGLLDGYQCTTHHDVIERIRLQAPAAQVKENRIFVEDRGVYTSAGITTGIDLALHLVHRHCGSGRARDVAAHRLQQRQPGGADRRFRRRAGRHPAAGRLPSARAPGAGRGRRITADRQLRTGALLPRRRPRRHAGAGPAANGVLRVEMRPLTPLSADVRAAASR